VALVVVVLVAHEMTLEAPVKQTLAAEVAALEILQQRLKLAVLVVQALLFFAIPAQFNISLVAR
jgi:hypothetical protein